MSADAPRRGWYLDLVAVLLLTGVAGGAVALGVRGVPRIALVLPLVLFLPGYALTAVLFPARHDPDDVDPFDGTTGLRDPVVSDYQIDGAERVALSVALSVAVVPAVAFVATFTRWGITLTPILYGVCGVTVTLAVLALGVRSHLPPGRRFGVSLARRSDPNSPLGTQRGGLRRVALAASVLVFLASVGLALAYPPQGDGFTEFYVETENVTGDTTTLHRSTYAVGESASLPLGVANHEHRDVRYTVVAELQRVGSDNTTVREEAELARERVSVEAGQRTTVDLDASPPFAGEGLRLRVYLFRGDAPADPNAGDAYRSLTLWVDVTAGDGRASLAAGSGAGR